MNEKELAQKLRDFDWYKITFPFNRSIINSTNKTTNKSLGVGSELLNLFLNYSLNTFQQNRNIIGLKA
ncbi:MAG: hypothetical protein AABY09_02660 [Nanoarchaeota archaeon]